MNDPEREFGLSPAAAHAQRREHGHADALARRIASEVAAEAELATKAAAGDGPVRYCRACSYDLSAVLDLTRRCPECGRAFDPDRDETLRLTPKRTWRERLARDFLFGSGLPKLALLVVVIASLSYGWAPMPRLGDGRMPFISRLLAWEWLGSTYGVFSRRGPQTKAHTVLWNDRVRTYLSRTVDGDLRLLVDRVGPDRWIVDVASADVRYGEVLPAFNRTRDGPLGLLINPSSPGPKREAAERAQRATMMGPFPLRRSSVNARSGQVLRVEGDEPTVLSALFGAYDVPTEPFRESEDQTMVWHWDPEAEELRQIPVEEAWLRGYDVPVRRSTWGAWR